MFHFVAPYAFHKPLHLLLNMDAARLADMIRLVNDGETIRDAEIECLRNGSRLDTLFTLSPIRNSSGKVIGISCFAKDITERRNFEKQLERDKLFIDQLIENASVLIAAANEKGNIVIFNRRFEEVSGYTKEEAIGKNPLELLVPPENRARIGKLMGTIQTNKPPLEVESPIRAKDGRLLTVTWNAAAMHLPSGHDGIVVVGQDITEQKRMQEELMQSKKLASIGELVSGVAHELNNPLTIIMGYSQLLVSERALWEKHREMAQKVLDAAGRSKRIVENLLAFARKKTLQKQELDINQILDKTLMLRENNLSVNNVVVVRRFEDNLPLVYADAHQLQQVFLNLINNAFDAMLEANGGGTLEVRTLRRDGSIAIEIIDDGPGVPEPIQEKIFDPFFTTKEVGKGTGLGMSLSYGIVKEHGGKIYLDRTFKTGAKFVVEFPVIHYSPDLAQTCNSTVSPSANR
jgi:two-component system NtrC family sensor kinase